MVCTLPDAVCQEFVPIGRAYSHRIPSYEMGLRQPEAVGRGCRGAGYPLPPGGARGESARATALRLFELRRKMDCFADACTLREFVGAQHDVPGANAWLGDALIHFV